MSPLSTTLIDRLQALTQEKQQVVLDLVEFLETDAWDTIYQGRLAKLCQEIQIGLDASARGEVIDGSELFDRLHTKLQQQRSAS